MEITIEGTRVVVLPLTANIVDVTINGVDEGSVLGQIDAKEAINHYGSDTLLSLIDRDDAIKYYGIEEKE